MEKRKRRIVILLGSLALAALPLIILAAKRGAEVRQDSL